MNALFCEYKKIPFIHIIYGVFGCLILLLLSTGYFGNIESENLTTLSCITSKFNINSIQLWINTLSIGGTGTWLLVLLPMFCAMPYINLFLIEIKSKNYIFQLSRTKVRKYIIFKFFGCGLYCSTILFTAMIIVLIISILRLGVSDIDTVFFSAPITSHIIKNPPLICAIIELIYTYCIYAFIIGIITITLSVFSMNAFTSSSSIALLLYIIGNIYSSYLGEFTRKTAECAQTGEELPIFNHLYDFLLLGNLAHGMPDFEVNFDKPYIIYIVFVLILIVLAYIVFLNLAMKKLILYGE